MVGAMVSSTIDVEAVAALPASSATRTSKVCGPSGESAGGVCAVVVEHAPYVPPSIRHSRTLGAPPVMNANVGVESAVGVDGGAIVTVGATVSTVQLRSAGVGSTLPVASRTRTRNMWAPSASALRSVGEVQAAKAPPSSEHSN